MSTIYTVFLLLSCIISLVFILALLMQGTSASRSWVWTYSVQVINEAHKSEYRVEKLNFTGQFVSVDTLKKSLPVFKPDAASADVCSFGYVSPGHGLKGKHVWVSSLKIWTRCMLCTR